MSAQPHTPSSSPRGDAIAHARAYIQAGLVLVPLQPNSKGPTVRGWNARERCWHSLENLPPRWSGGLGLAHAYSRTCALDVDVLDRATELLGRHGIPLRQAFTSPRSVRIDSGRPGRAKFVFRLPEGVEPLRTVRVSEDERTIYELRCATADGLTVQDVLPPSIHPDTGKPYTWGGAGDWHRIPCLPGLVLMHWRELIEAQPKTTLVDDDPLLHLPPRDEQIEELRQALAWIPADNYETWIAMGHALRAAGPVGEELWLEWSQSSPKWRDGDEARWSTFSPARTGWHAVFARASRHGWINPRSAAGRTLTRLDAPAPQRGEEPEQEPSEGDTPAKARQQDDWPPPMPPSVAAALIGSDLWCARRALELFGRDIAYVAGLGWMEWTKAGWSKPSRHQPVRRIHGLAASLQRESVELLRQAQRKPEGSPDRDALLTESELVQKAGWKLEQASAIRAVWSLLESYLRCEREWLDADPYLVGLPSGRVLHIGTRQTRPARRTDWVTRRLGVEYDPTARAPVFESFMRQLTRPRPDDPVFGRAARPDLAEWDEGMHRWLRRHTGYCLLGEQREHLITIAIGGGGNGKSTYYEAWRYIFNDYAYTPNKALFARSRFGTGDQATMLNDIEGIRLAFASEASEFDQLNEETLKQLSGSDTVNARRLYESSRQVTPVCKLVMYSNARPAVSGVDQGIWRRLRFLPFDHRPAPGEVDIHLPKKLRAEAAGMLNLLLDWFAEYEAFGLDGAESERMRALYDSAKMEANPVREFWEQVARPAPTAMLRHTDAYLAYSRWHRDMIGGHPITPKRFSRLSEASGIVTLRKSGGLAYRGYTLQTGFDDDE